MSAEAAAWFLLGALIKKARELVNGDETRSGLGTTPAPGAGITPAPGTGTAPVAGTVTTPEQRAYISGITVENTTVPTTPLGASDPAAETEGEPTTRSPSIYDGDATAEPVVRPPAQNTEDAAPVFNDVRTQGGGDSTLEIGDPTVAVGEPTDVVTAPAGYSMEQARDLAPQLAANITRFGYNYSRDMCRRFQLYAGIKVDGIYGGCTREALLYYNGSAPRALFAPLTCGEGPYVPWDFRTALS